MGDGFVTNNDETEGDATNNDGTEAEDSSVTLHNIRMSTEL